MKKALIIAFLFTVTILVALAVPPTLKGTATITLPDSLKSLHNQVAELKLVISPAGTVDSLTVVTCPQQATQLVSTTVQSWQFNPGVDQDSTAVSAPLRLQVYLVKNEADKTNLVPDNRDSLKTEIMKFNDRIMNRKQIWQFNPNAIMLNDHVGALEAEPTPLSRQGFNILPSPAKSSLLAAIYARTDTISVTPAGIQLHSPYYPYPVLFTSARLGSGDYDQNYAHISMWKNHLLQIEGLNFKGDFSAVDGWWMDTLEESADFNVELSKKWQKFYLQTGYTSLNEDIADFGIKRDYRYNTTNPVQLRQSNWRVKGGYKWLQLGFAYTDESYKALLDTTYSRTMWQSLAQSNLTLANHQFNLSWQHVQDKSNYLFQSKQTKTNSNIYQIEHIGGKDNLETHQIYSWGGEFVRNFTTQAGWRFAPGIYTGFAHTKYYRDQNYLLSTTFKTLEKTGGELRLNWRWLNLNAQAGERRQSYPGNGPHSMLYIQANPQISFNISRLQVKTWANLEYIDKDDIEYLPPISGDAGLVLTWELEHDNTLEAGLRNNYWDDYYADGLYLQQGNLLSAWFAIHITRLFQVKVEGFNLNNAYYAYGQPLPGRHYNFKLVWNFIN